MYMRLRGTGLTSFKVMIFIRFTNIVTISGLGRIRLAFLCILPYLLLLLHNVVE